MSMSWDCDYLPCQECCKTFNKARQLKIHQRTHWGERPYPCKECRKRHFLDQIRHTKKTYWGEKPYQSKECLTACSGFGGHQCKDTEELIWERNHLVILRLNYYFYIFQDSSGLAQDFRKSPRKTVRISLKMVKDLER